LGATDQDRRNYRRFFIILMHILLGLIFPGSAEADFEQNRKLNSHL